MDISALDAAWPTIVAILVAIGGAWWVNRASGAKNITEATQMLLAPLTERIDLLDKELSEAKGRIKELEGVVQYNKGQLGEARKALEGERAERVKDRQRLTRLERWAAALREQIIKLGETPVSFDDIKP